MDTYEKKYKEAVNKIKNLLDDGEKNGFTIVTYKTDLESIFPELKESKDEKVRKEIVEYLKKNLRLEWATWLEKQCKKPQRMISAEAKEAMYDKPADTVELKCEESKTRIFDAPTPFEDKLYAFVLACEILVDPSKREFILEHSQEILDAAREQIGKEQSSAWSEKDEEMRLTVLQDLQNIKESYPNVNVEPEFNWLKSLKDRVQPQNCIYYNPYKEVVESIAEMCKHYDKASHSGLRDFYDNVNVKCKDAKEYDSLFPQNTWNPSDEQIQAVRLARAFVTDDFSENPTLSDILVELEEQLKKLREE